MVNSSKGTNQGTDQSQPPRKSRRSRWLKIGLGTGAVVLVAAAGGAWWLSRYVRQELAPLVSKQLTEILQRPVEVGEITGFGLSQLRFGESRIPATPTDSDRVTIPALVVRFHPWQALQERTLSLQITAIDAQVYLEQDADGTWLATSLNLAEPSGPLTIEVAEVRLDNGTVTVVPRSPEGLVGSPVELSQIQAHAQLQQDQSTFTADLQGQLGADASLNLTASGDFQLQEATAQVQGQNLPLPLLLGLVANPTPLPFALTSGSSNVDLSLGVTAGQLTSLQGSLNLDNLSAQLPDRPLPLSLDTAQLTLKTAELSGGQLTALQGNLKLNNLSAPFADSSTPLTLASAQVNLDNLTLSDGDLNSLTLLGNLSLDNLSAPIPTLPDPLTVARGQMSFKDDRLIVDDLKAQLANLTAVTTGSVNWRNQTLDLVTTIAAVDLGEILTTLALKPPVAVGGTVDTRLSLGGTFAQPTLEGEIETVGGLQVDRLGLRSASTRFGINNVLALIPMANPAPDIIPTLSLQGTRLVAELGGVVQGGGSITLTPDLGLALDFFAEALPLEALAQAYGSTVPVALGNLSAQTQIRGTLANPQVVAQFQALEAAYPLQGQVQLLGDVLVLDNAVISVAGGTLRAQGRQAGDRWRLAVNASQVQPSLLDLPVEGIVDGIFNLSGPRNSFTPQDIRAQGDVTLSQGVSLIRSPLTATWAWNGKDLAILEARATGFQGRGTIAVALPGDSPTPGITGLDLAVQLTDYGLATLPLALPPQLDLQGQASFNGTLQGTPTAPRIQGTVAVANLAVNQTPFDTQLAGNIAQTAQGLALTLAGDNDQLQLNLDADYQPQYAFIQRDQGTVQARRQDQQFNINIQQFPLSTLGLKAELPQLGEQVVAGLVSGQVNLDLESLVAVGGITVSQPNWGTLQADYAQTQFRFANNALDLFNGVFALGDSRFSLEGRGVLAEDPQFKLAIAVEQGQVRDFLTALQWFDLVDVGRGLLPPSYDTAGELGSLSVGIAQAPVGQQLQRFSEIKARVSRTLVERQEQRKIPPLRELEGAFGGSITVAGSRDQGIQAQFNLGGEDWSWGDYHANRVALTGEFADNQFTLQPVLLESDTMEVRFAGTLGGERQTGQLTIQELPVGLVRQFIDVPVDVEGQFNLQATLGGSVADPQILGDLSLVNGTLNQVSLVTRETGFSYLNGRLQFGGVLELDRNAATPVLLNGDIPYALPFSTVQPDSNAIDISLKVQDEGLALVSLISQDNLTWLGGKGEVTLKVGGTVQEPIAEGEVVLRGASVSAKALPEGEIITDLVGTIRFVRDRLQVDQLVGQFSEGQVTAVGILPLAVPFADDDRDRATPLAVNFQNLNLNLPGLYNGGAGGDVRVIGSALNPRITGTVQLQDGDVFIPDPATVALQQLRRLRQGDNPPAANALAISPITFDNLTLQLADQVNVTSQPLFSFRAVGDLIINGGLGDLRPEGTINVTRGQVNLFTTSFILARRRENVAIFRPENGLDPDLDVELQASVTEISNQIPTAGPIAQSEILDSPVSSLNELQTIRIRASVVGPASKLLQNLSLSSRPARSQSELYALVGGGFVNTLGQGGDSTLALANLAGSALINNLQSAINNVLSGPVDFRLFPTIVDSNRSKEQADNDATPDQVSNTLALGAELGINLTNSMSFSVLRLLTLDLPTRFNLRYQLNDNLQLRGASDFQGDNRFVVEYERRF